MSLAFLTDKSERYAPPRKVCTTTIFDCIWFSLIPKQLIENELTADYREEEKEEKEKEN